MNAQRDAVQAATPPLDARVLAACIDHTLLEPGADAEAIDTLVDEALMFGFASVCVHGVWVKRVRERLAQAARDGRSAIPGVCAVVDFPFGCAGSCAKAAHARALARDGANELDVVMFPPATPSGDVELMRSDIAPLVNAVHEVNPNIVVKAILETAAMEAAATSDAVLETMLARACEASRIAGCDFVKTSTGFHEAGGATARTVALLRKHAGRLRVKASGGIRTLVDARAMLDAGADRLGCSKSVAIVKEAEGKGIRH